MHLDSLEKLEDAELRAIISRAEELLKQHDAERKERALAEARAVLAAVGLSLKDLPKAKGKPAKTPSYKGGHTYRHPADKSLQWTAKGKKPNWLAELEGEGKAPVEIAADGQTVSTEVTHGEPRSKG